jgi:uncharacterized protein YkwD
MRLSNVLTVGFLFIATSLSYAGMSNFEPKTARLGNDYTNHSSATLTKENCRDLCENDANCKAFTFVKKGALNPQVAVCFLKNAFGEPNLDYQDSYSGIKTPSGTSFTTQQGVYYPGSDYKNFGVLGENNTSCKNQCAVESNCIAWTFTKNIAGQGKSGCWLKEYVAGAVTNATSTSGIKGTLNKDAQLWLKAHNDYRAQHSSPAVVWSGELAKNAQDWANACTEAHAGTGGENLCMSSALQTPQWVVDYWYSEEPDYNYSNPGYSSTTGHFTQVVWKSTQKIGCAHAECPSAAWRHYWVCRYSPAGNVTFPTGLFAENVLRKQ